MTIRSTINIYRPKMCQQEQQGRKPPLAAVSNKRFTFNIISIDRRQKEIRINIANKILQMFF